MKLQINQYQKRNHLMVSCTSWKHTIYILSKVISNSSYYFTEYKDGSKGTSSSAKMHDGYSKSTAATFSEHSDIRLDTDVYQNDKKLQNNYEEEMENKYKVTLSYLPTEYFRLVSIFSDHLEHKKPPYILNMFLCPFFKCLILTWICTSLPAQNCFL